MAPFLLIWLMIFSPAETDDWEFTRDVLKVAHSEWMFNNQAELIEQGVVKPDTYGYKQIVRYSTVQGEVDVIYYFTVNSEVYDVGILREEFELMELDGADRILQRVLWGQSITTSSVLSTLWFVGTGSIHIEYDGIIGSQEAVLKAFIDDVVSSPPTATAITVEQQDDTIQLILAGDGKELVMLVKPNLYLYLNGQTDVVQQMSETVIQGEVEIDLAVNVHPFHQFEVENPGFSARFITVDREDLTVQFTRDEAGWKTEDDLRAFSSDEHPEINELYTFWLTRNFPDQYQSGIRTSDDFESTIMIEGVEKPSVASNSEPVLDMIGWLGSELVAYTEISEFEVDGDTINTTTYLLYYNPDLNYQHMIRSVDRYTSNNGNLVWEGSNMMILPAVRLDNIGQLYGTGSFPVEGYERLFNSN